MESESPITMTFAGELGPAVWAVVVPRGNNESPDSPGRSSVKAVNKTMAAMAARSKTGGRMMSSFTKKGGTIERDYIRMKSSVKPARPARFPIPPPALARLLAYQVALPRATAPAAAPPAIAASAPALTPDEPPVSSGVEITLNTHSSVLANLQPPAADGLDGLLAVGG